MKNKIYALIPFILLCMLITGCADSTTDETPQAGAPVETPQTDAPPEAPSAATPGSADTSNRGSRRTPEERAAAQVDIDLSVLNETMLSAEIINIYSNGDEFLGMTIRVSGTYGYADYEEYGVQYHYVVTKQGDACCQEGFEIVWTGDHVFPDDYPLIGTPIEVDGVLDIYEEDGYYYYYLIVDDIFILG